MKDKGIIIIIILIIVAAIAALMFTQQGSLFQGGGYNAFLNVQDGQNSFDKGNTFDVRYQVKLLGGGWDKPCTIGKYYLFLDDKVVESDEWGISTAYCPANDKKNKIFSLADADYTINTANLDKGQHRIDLLVVATDITDPGFYENIANNWAACDVSISSFDKRYEVVACDRVGVKATDTYRFNIEQPNFLQSIIDWLKGLLKL